MLSACGEETEPGGNVEAIRTTSVTVTRAEARDIDYVLTALGSVESIHNPTISAETSGQMASIDVADRHKAVAAIGGIVSSTLLTLLVVPVAYSLLDRWL
ncbi:MAG: hypothetical protein V7709_16540 [Halioglobus sp.]